MDIRNTDVIRELQNQIDDYITNYLCKRYLADEYYGIDEDDYQMPRPNWRDDIIGNQPDRWLECILAETINAGGIGDYNHWTFYQPTHPEALPTMFNYISLTPSNPNTPITYDDTLPRHDASFCRLYISRWLGNNLDYLKNKLLEYRLERIAVENRDE